jgi:hypothetical protein
MWLKGKKQNPRITYTAKGDNKMLDVVTFEKKGKTKQIVGFDERSAEYKEGFVWQGHKGIKSVISRKWKVLFYNKEYQLALLFFEKTLFSPGGFDVISRKKNLTEKRLNLIEKLLPKIGVSENLTTIKQD